MVYPTQHLIFLGVLLDTVQCSMSMPEDKLEALRSYQLEFSLHCRASKRQLWVLAGKLNWACRVVFGARLSSYVFSTRLTNLTPLMLSLNSIKSFVRICQGGFHFYLCSMANAFFSRGYLLLMYKQMHPHMGQVPFFVEIGFTIPLSWVLLP